METEFSIPTAGEGQQPGRMTVMGAGGSVQANVDRWYGQFSQPDGGSTKDKTKTQKLKVGGVDVHYVDIAGTFKDQPGPVAPAVMRENYRMLAAIIVTEKQGMHFLKFYGPKATVVEAPHDRVHERPGEHELHRERDEPARADVREPAQQVARDERPRRLDDPPHEEVARPPEREQDPQRHEQAAQRPRGDSSRICS